MAVLIILGVLVGLVVPRFINVEDNAGKNTEAYMDKAVERKARQEYFALEIKGISLEDYIEKRLEEEREKRNEND